MAINYSFTKDYTLNQNSPLYFSQDQGIFLFKPIRITFKDNNTGEPFYKYYDKEEEANADIFRANNPTSNITALKKSTKYPNFDNLKARLRLANKLILAKDLKIDFRDEIEDFVVFGVINPNTLSGLSKLYEQYEEDNKSTLVKLALRELSNYKDKRLVEHQVEVGEGISVATSFQRLQALTSLLVMFRESEKITTAHFKYKTGHFISLDKAKTLELVEKIQAYHQACFTAEKQAIEVLRNLDTYQLYLMAVYASTSILSDSPTALRTRLRRIQPSTTVKIVYEEELNKLVPGVNTQVLQLLKDRLSFLTGDVVEEEEEETTEEETTTEE